VTTRSRAPDLRPPVQLRELRYFKQLFDSAGLAAIASEPSGKITYANPAAERLFGWGPGELTDQPVSILNAPGQHTVTFDEVLDAGGSWAGVMLGCRKSGAVFPKHLSITIVHEEFDQPRGMISFVTDETSRQRRMARNQRLVELGAALNAETDLDRLLGRICQDARELFDVDGVYLWRYEESTDTLHGVTFDGPPEPRFDGLRLSQLDDHHASYVAIRERRAVFRHDLPPDGVCAELVESIGAKAMLVAPMLRGERIVGALSMIDCQQPLRFDSADARDAQAFAVLATAAVEDARVHQAERDKSERLTGLARVGALLTESPQREAVLEAIVEGARRLLNADEVRIWLLKGPDGPLSLAHVWPEDSPCLRELGLRDTKVGAVALTGEAWQTADMRSDTKAVWQTRTVERLSACLMVALRARQQPIGALSIFSAQPRVFDEQDVELAQTFAHQAALAVDYADALAAAHHTCTLRPQLERAQLSPKEREVLEHLLIATNVLLPHEHQALDVSNESTER
jgi:PAS domain S-box-containing protein